METLQTGGTNSNAESSRRPSPLCAILEVVINEGLQKIGLGAFQHCSLFESIWLPSTVSEVEMYTFYNCREIQGGGSQ
ncbi:hypothetical protein ACHAXR_002454 [Thalassiosira sp. AJA248-18]